MVRRIGSGLSEVNSTKEVDQEVKMKQFPLRYIKKKFESSWDSTKRSAQNFEHLKQFSELDGTQALEDLGECGVPILSQL